MKYNLDRLNSIAEFDSIGEFYNYICETPINNTFRWETLKSSEVSDYRLKFTQTKDFEEATQLIKNGWSEMANKLNTKLNANPNNKAYISRRKTFNSMAGYQANIPLYLMGVPENMINSKMVPMKQKVVNISKSVSYHVGISADKIVDESIKALQIVQKLEAQGYRVNLSIVLGSSEYNRNLYVKVCIKHATEKLNISKVAFPLVHPSMLRRLFFRYIEVCPDTTKSFAARYGRPEGANKLSKIYPNEIIIPAILPTQVDDIKTLEDLKSVCKI